MLLRGIVPSVRPLAVLMYRPRLTSLYSRGGTWIDARCTPMVCEWAHPHPVRRRAHVRVSAFKVSPLVKRQICRLLAELSLPSSDGLFVELHQLHADLVGHGLVLARLEPRDDGR